MEIDGLSTNIIFIPKNAKLGKSGIFRSLEIA
jgi:hypothetical protein